jgi:hypothetical protein
LKCAAKLQNFTRGAFPTHPNQTPKQRCQRDQRHKGSVAAAVLKKSKVSVLLVSNGGKPQGGIGFAENQDDEPPSNGGS